MGSFSGVMSVVRLGVLNLLLPYTVPYTVYRIPYTRFYMPLTFASRSTKPRTLCTIQAYRRCLDSLAQKSKAICVVSLFGHTAMLQPQLASRLLSPPQLDKAADTVGVMTACLTLLVSAWGLPLPYPNLGALVQVILLQNSQTGRHSHSLPLSLSF